LKSSVGCSRAVEERDLEGVLAAYDSEVEIHEADSLPYGGVYRGHEGAVQHAAGYLQAWDAHQGRPSVR
jgi:uncharacterized protein